MDPAVFNSLGSRDKRKPVHGMNIGRLRQRMEDWHGKIASMGESLI